MHFDSEILKHALKKFVIIFVGEQSPSQIYKEIVEMAKKVQNIQDEYVEIVRENAKYQRKIEKLDQEIKKQSVSV